MHHEEIFRQIQNMAQFTETTNPTSLKSQEKKCKFPPN